MPLRLKKRLGSAHALIFVSWPWPSVPGRPCERFLGAAQVLASPFEPFRSFALQPSQRYRVRCSSDRLSLGFASPFRRRRLRNSSYAWSVPRPSRQYNRVIQSGMDRFFETKSGHFVVRETPRPVSMRALNGRCRQFVNSLTCERVSRLNWAEHCWQAPSQPLSSATHSRGHCPVPRFGTGNSDRHSGETPS